MRLADSWPIRNDKHLNMAKNYQCIIFDCDGVLVDSEFISNSTMVQMANELGANMTMEMALSNFIGKSLSTCIRMIDDMIDGEIPKDFETSFRQRTFERFQNELQPVEGIPELLPQIRIPYCVASSGPRNKIRLNLGTTQLLRYFEGRIFSCYDIQKWKPEPDIFLYAAKEMGFGPKQCLVIEDTITGVRAAKSGGFDVVAIARPHSRNELEKESIPLISHPSELRAILNL